LSNQLLCPKCEGSINDNDHYCPTCGYNLQDWKEAKGIIDKPENPPTLMELFIEAVNSFFRPSPFTSPPSSSIFFNRTQKSISRYLIIAVFLFVAGLGFSYGGDWLTYFGFTLAGYAVPIILLLYIITCDRYEREPIALVAYCFGWGAFSGIIAGILNAVITSPYLGAGGAGFIEEPLKIVGVYYIAKNTRLKNEFNDHLDGMVYGAAAGAGFAGMENFWYITEMVFNGAYPPLVAIFIRSITGIMHILWSSIAARSLGVAKVSKGYLNWSDLIPGTLVSAFLHLLWNIGSTFFTLALVFPFTLNAVRAMIRTALKDEYNWGYVEFAPDEKE
jgi:RsiW-degrading membrane proteinase PrsW (M82 family)